MQHVFHRIECKEFGSHDELLEGNAHLLAGTTSDISGEAGVPRFVPAPHGVIGVLLAIVRGHEWIAKIVSTYWVRNW